VRDRSQIFDTQTEFNRSWTVLVIAAVRCAVRENLGTIRDRQAGFMFFLIANVRDTDAAATAVEAIGLTRSLPVWTGFPFTLVMTSPDCKPAFSAGLPASTRCNTIP